MSEQDTISNPPSECTEVSEEDGASVKSLKQRSTRSSRIAASASASSEQVDALRDQRRHSTRSVKRRKFDDELVESSLNNKPEKLARGMPKPPADSSPTADSLNKSDIIESETTSVSQTSLTSTSTVGRTTRSTASSTQIATPTAPAEKPSTSASGQPSAHLSIPANAEKRKATTKNTAKGKSKRPKRVTLPAQASATSNLGRWKPQDDLLLIEAVQQTADLKCVHVGVKFSCNFKLREIEDRWYALLYNEKISKLAMAAIHQLPYDEVLRIQSKALFSRHEEDLLSTVTVASQPTQATFSELLKTNVRKFYKSRTSRSLQEHWCLMKQYHLLPDQSVLPLPKNDHILNFSDAEELLDDKQLLEPPNILVQKEMALNDRKQKREIRTLEQELPKWQVLVESVTGSSHPDFDNQTLAILRGRLVRYLMRSKEISIGRAAKDNLVDVDLSLEGPAFKISRRQGFIKLRNSGEFILTNSGKRPMYVDSRPVLPNAKLKLHHNSVIEITCLRFIFLINQDLIGNIKTEVQKTTSAASSTGPS